MTLKTEERLIQILDDYSSGITNSLEVLAQRNGCSVRSLFAWMRDKDLTVTWNERTATFGQQMNAARSIMKAVTIGRSLEDYVLNGRLVPVYHHGQPQFKISEELAAMGEDFVLNSLGLPDMYERDENNCRIPLMRREFAPSQLIEAYARANAPGLYGIKSEVTMRGNVDLGVRTVGQRAAPPLPVQDVQPVEQITETRALAPVTNTPEVFEPEPIDDVQPVAAEPEQVYSDVPSERERIAPATPRPVGYAEIPAREPKSELERSLFAALEAARNRAQS